MDQSSLSRKLVTAARARRAGVPRHRRGPWLPVAAATLLAALGIAGVCPSAAQASAPPVLNWTEQHPATSPPALQAGAMAYDAATRTMVLFGGETSGQGPPGTWTWNGSTWAKQHPPAHPPAVFGLSMAYEAATRTMVLFGGLGGSGLLNGDTWTWNGSTWTQHHPSPSPPARFLTSMAYDAATGTVVLFGGEAAHHGTPGGVFGDTWTWNGATWTKEHPPAHPPALADLSMAYDAATGTVVLFGGGGRHGTLGDTWTWDGSTWTKQHPATSPAARSAESMAYDPATGTAVLFGGNGTSSLLGDTWVWGPN